MPLSPTPLRYDAVLFDLLSALLDSWTLWDTVAGGREPGRRWRMQYLQLTYGCGTYVDYEVLVHRSAKEAGLSASVAEALVHRWSELAPWPEARKVLAWLATYIPVGVVTNCSQCLGEQAANCLGVPLRVVTAERAGAYKPDARPYQLALAELGLPAARVLFVAGSASDVGGASRVGMPVYWHNRIGLSLPHGSPAPLVETRTLRDLHALLDPGFVTRMDQHSR